MPDPTGFSSVVMTLTSLAARKLFGAAIEEIGYMRNCTEHVETLRHEAQKLKVMKGRVQQRIDIAIHKGQKLSYGVEEWVKDADTGISKADEFLQQVQANAKYWETLRRYGKSAKAMALSVVRLQERGDTFESSVVVKIPAPGPLDVYQSKCLDDIHTHNSALGDIIKSLKDDSIQIIGIYGLGGVGKTTLAKEVVAKVKYTLFAHVAFTTVSQKVDIKKIKVDIGEATKRIMKGDNILIILDDVWGELNLEQLRIPCGSNFKNCKILLTSRSEKVCQKMNAQSRICVPPLPTKEAWILFKRVVGERVETDADLKPVAEEVAKECGGLPLLIQAVGKALKDESIHSWEAALSQLKKPVLSEMDPDIKKAFTHLKLSYDYLKSKEAKSCFLLCSLYPEDTDISLEDLVRYRVGLEKFHNVDSIEKARGRVQIAMGILTSSGLLLNSEWKGRKKMHDVVRDVALLIASKGNNKFLVEAGRGLTEWLPRDTGLESYVGISLMDNRINKLPYYQVHLPQLQFLIACGNHELSMISDEFIGSMQQLKVLDISWNKISSLPRSFQRLTKLRTLDLRGNKSLHKISILGELTDLEILILNGTGIAEIPQEIARLVKLRVLEVNDCGDLSCITRGVISALLRLEELCIEFNSNFNGVSDCIVEVTRLSKLTYLDLTVPSIDDIPTQCFNFETLKGFVIQIGKYNRSYDLNFVNMSRSDRYLIFSTGHLKIPLVKWLKKVIEVSRPCPHTYLIGIENLNNIMPTLCDEGFNNLEHIKLSECQSVSCLVDNSTSCSRGEGLKKYFMQLEELELYELNKLEVIWKCPDECISLANLARLQIWGCGGLKRVFTVSVAQSLVNLKYLCIKNCKDIEEVIYGGAAGGNVIMFRDLTSIYLRILPSLRSFLNSENCSTIKYPSLMDVQIYECVNMKMWGPGNHETPQIKTLFVNQDVPTVLDGAFSINETVEKSWRKYKDDEEEE